MCGTLLLSVGEEYVRDKPGKTAKAGAANSLRFAFRMKAWDVAVEMPVLRLVVAAGHMITLVL